MMIKLINWLKANKLTAFLFLVVAYLLFKNSFGPVLPLTKSVSRMSTGSYETALESINLGPISDVATSKSFGQVAPAPEVTDRLVIKESTVSLLVKKVAEVQKMISQKAQEMGGYMVNTYLSHPEEAEAASGSITVRVPQVKLEQALDYFRSQAVKVVSENLSGRDVTDEYVDIEARLATLYKTKTKFEEILAKSEQVDDLLRVQRELVNLQEQIDALKGQQQYLEKSAQMSRVTVYLATDELALPYAPTEAWRPKVIFKKAARSLVGSFRKAGTVLIWLGVYAVIWVPALVIYKLIQRRRKKNL
jgi:hypothetical protein